MVANRRDHFNAQGLKSFLESQGFSVELEHHGENVGIFHAQRRSSN
jgi:hypothetical protein